jgi:sarcosine/dimethylglycine N-methyltransferase
MQMVVSLPPDPLGLHAFVPGFAPKAENLRAALADGRLRAIQCLAQAS